eukprot:7126466-Prymnesium_polylepis.1
MLDASARAEAARDEYVPSEDSGDDDDDLSPASEGESGEEDARPVAVSTGFKIDIRAVRARAESRPDLDPSAPPSVTEESEE